MDMVEPGLSRDLIEDTTCELTLSSEPNEDLNFFGEPEIIPRVGEDYQVSLPELRSQSEYEKELRSEEIGNDFLSGLPLSVMWVQSGSNTHKHDAADSEEQVKSVVNGKGNNGSSLVPGSSHEPLNKTEDDSFLLGLYIFGRDFLRVKNFMGSRKTGEILSHYYEKFYGSQRHRRWVKCMKMRGKRCACGQKLFRGVRQQELLSRLLPKLPEDGKSKLLEVSKTFSEGKLLLEEYATTLKNIAGLNNLVEAVGIGKGKQDLTKMALDKSNQAIHPQPRWPTKRIKSTNRGDRSYLKPKIESCEGDVTFTIVDTTVVDGGNCSFREVRCLPAEINDRVPPVESRYLSFGMVDARVSDPVKIICFEKKAEPENVGVDNSLNGAVEGFNDNEGTSASKCQKKSRKNPNEEDSSAPEVIKRRKVRFVYEKKQMGSCNAGSKETKTKLVKEETNSCSSTDLLKNRSSVITREHENDPKKARSLMLVDLNVPIVPDPEIAGGVNVEMPMEQHNRRQSRRNRVMSTKALEAIASGLIMM